jgi:vacuolar protein sorting-associated protein 13A/C
MLEGLLEKVLIQYLGQYLEFEKDKLKVGIWSGDIQLHNIQLKPSALDALRLPIKVYTGFLSSLIVSIPWKNLWNAPVKINIEGLYVLASPSDSGEDDLDYAAAKQFARASKQAKIRDAENVRTMIQEASKDSVRSNLLFLEFLKFFWFKG